MGRALEAFTRGALWLVSLARTAWKPKRLFTELTGAGAGWYFFLVSQFGHHTRVVAVESAKGRRKFFLLEHLGDPDIEEDITNDVNGAFDDFNRPDGQAGQGLKVWQIYAKPELR